MLACRNPPPQHRIQYTKPAVEGRDSEVHEHSGKYAINSSLKKYDCVKITVTQVWCVCYVSVCLLECNNCLASKEGCYLALKCVNCDSHEYPKDLTSLFPSLTFTSHLDTAAVMIHTVLFSSCYPIKTRNLLIPNILSTLFCLLLYNLMIYKSQGFIL